MKESGGVEIVYACDTSLFNKCISISDEDFAHVFYELREYGQAVKVVNGFHTHVAIHPYKLLIDARGAVNPKGDYIIVRSLLESVPKYAGESNVQYTLLLDETSPIPKEIFAGKGN